MIYLDNNATTPVDPEVLDEMFRVAGVAYGNPGSRHIAGRKARRVLEDARESIASAIGAEPGEVIFTSGGTESSNLAIMGLTAGRQGTVLLPPGEHPATVEPVKRLVQRGCRQQKLQLTRTGQLEPSTFDSVSWSEVILTTALIAHNETGTLTDLQQLIDLSLQNRVPVHLDAVQAIGKIPVSFRDLGATTMSAGAHKFHGPRGIGLLAVREETRLRPQMVGGFQEHGKRAGTEPVMLAAGMAKALQRCCESLAERHSTLKSLRDELQNRLERDCAPVVINGDQTARLPNTLNIAFPGCNADALLVALDLHGICCSHGSACASGSAEPAPILLGMNCPPEVYQSSIRFSVGMQNEMAEIETAAEIIAATVNRLRNT